MHEDQQYPRISVIIPTRNEARNLSYVLPYIPPMVNEVIIVDGHSIDGTIAVARQLLPDVRIIRQMGRGKGDALRIGFAACTGDIIVMIDADGSTNPSEIPRFVEALLAGFDFAKGSRFIKGGGSHDITPVRSLGNYGLSQLVNLLFGTQFSDLCYGYNAFWKGCLDHIAIDCDGFEVETQINIRAQKARLRIVEVPSVERPRNFGQSNLRTFRDGWRVLKTIVRERACFDRPENQRVPILMYHSISKQAGRKFKSFAVSPQLFAEHMAYLHQQGYTPITVTQFVNSLAKRGPGLPTRPIVLTFDDGFADFFTDALPVLKRYGFAATLYVPTAFVGATSRWLQQEGESQRPMLAWDQLQAICASGVECGAHSHFHYQLDTLPHTIAQKEIVQSKRILEDRLGRPVASFAYPFGYYTSSVRTLVHEAGYTSACAVKHAFSSDASDPFALARLMVGPDMYTDALHALLTGRGTSAMQMLYARTRTPVWQAVRRTTASLGFHHSYGGGQQYDA